MTVKKLITVPDETLRKKFKGTPENVINYFFMVAEEVREIMAMLGIKKFQDLIGRSEFLEKNQVINQNLFLLPITLQLQHSICLQMISFIILRRV